MDKKRRQEPQWWPERQGAGLRESARHEFETSPAGRRQQARLLLRKDEWDEEKTYQREDGKRPELAHQ